MTYNENKIGLSIGSLFGFMHLLWVILVTIGLGQRIAGLSHNMHGFQDMHTIGSIGFGTAVVGVISAAVVGYIVGYVAAWLLNRFDK
jgi:hypothetical protein